MRFQFSNSVIAVYVKDEELYNYIIKDLYSKFRTVLRTLANKYSD